MRRTASGFFELCMLLVVVFLSAGLGTAYGQASGTISGTIRDNSGGVLPGVSIVARNLETGVERTGVTNDAGFFRFPNIDPGSYQVEATLTGFKATGLRGITISAGREAVVDLALEIGEVSEEVIVMGDAPLVQTTNAAISELVDSTKIQNLPLNGRDYMQLATLQPGVHISQSQQTTVDRRTSRGLGVWLSLAGGRPTQNAFLLDGTDINSYANNTPGSSARVTLGTESLREFQILTSTFSAEFGRSSGGVINAVTKSGTNQLHGSAFEFHRNDALDAPNYFDVKKPDFHRNQFGGSLGGPIVQNRVHFFGAYEGLRETLGKTAISLVPSAAGRAGNLGGRIVPVDPVVVPYMDVFPLPNGRIFNDGTGEFLAAPAQVTNEHYAVGKVDFQLGPNDSLFVRHTFNDGAVAEPNQFLITDNRRESKNYYTTVAHNRIVSSSILNTARAAYNHTYAISGLLVPLVDVPDSLSWVPGRPFGIMNISGVGALAGPGSGSDLEKFNYNLLHVSDTLNWTKGVHSLKFGADFRRIWLNQDNTNAADGVYNFSSLENFLAARNSLFEVTPPGSDTVRHWTQNLIAFFAQDDFKATDTLTLNVGVRYEFVTIPSERDGKEANFRTLGDKEATVGDLFNNPSKANFAPRVGLAWDVFGDGRTAVRSGFGVFYDQLLTHYFTQVGNRNPPFFYRFNSTGLPFPNAYQFVAVDPNQPLRVDIFQYEADQPYRMQWNLSLQRELFAQAVMTVAYLGARADHLVRSTEDVNLARGTLVDGRVFFPPGQPKRYPGFGAMRYRSTDSEAFYNALQVGFNKRFSQGFQFQASYSFSKSIDDGSTVFDDDEFQNSTTSPNADDKTNIRGPSDFDVRHNFSLNYTIDLPFARNSSGLTKAALAGWQLGGIMTLTSGNPFTVILGFDRAGTTTARAGGDQRPDLHPGADNNPVDPGNPDLYFDPLAFDLPPANFLGDLGRNTLIGPGVTTFDLSLSKNFAIGAQRSLQFKADFFNIFDRANFQIPSNRTIFTASGRVATAGRITSTTTTARQIQLSVRYVF